MAKFELKLNLSGVRALRKCPEMQAMILQYAEGMAESSGSGYHAYYYMAPGRVVGVVKTRSRAAKKDNSENNTLLRSAQSYGH